MLNLQEFFDGCAGFWTTERTYHSTDPQEVERSYTEYQVTALTGSDKQQILAPTDTMPIAVDDIQVASNYAGLPGFAIAFDTVSEKGEKVSMSLRALFVPDMHIISAGKVTQPALLPSAAQVSEQDEIIQGYYLRDEGYAESGAIAGRFTYQPTRQTLEMTTYYRQSVAVDQMRFIAPNLRMRTIVTYKRPQPIESAVIPTEITLVGFGLEQRQ